MDTLRLLITDNALLLSEKGKLLLEKTFATDEECAALIESILSKRKKAHVECLVSGNRLVSETRIIHYANPELFVADEKMVKLLIENASHTFLEGYKDRQLEVIQSEIVEILLNGYPVKTLKKQRVNDLQLSVFLVAIPTAYKKKFKGHFSFSSFARHQAERVRTLAKKEEFIVCSVYENSTDLSIRKASGLFETTTVSLGTHQVLEHIAKGLSISNEEAEGRLLKYREGSLDPTLAIPLEAALLSFTISLDEEIKKSLTKLCDGISLPEDVYLLVSSTFEKAFENAFKSESYHSMCFSEKGFEVKNMSSILKA